MSDDSHPAAGNWQGETAAEQEGSHPHQHLSTSGPEAYALTIEEQAAMLCALPPYVRDPEGFSPTLRALLETREQVFRQLRGRTSSMNATAHDLIRLAASGGLAQMSRHIPPTNRRFADLATEWADYLADLPLLTATLPTPLRQEDVAVRVRFALLPEMVRLQPLLDHCDEPDRALVTSWCVERAVENAADLAGTGADRITFVRALPVAAAIVVTSAYDAACDNITDRVSSPVLFDAARPWAAFSRLARALQMHPAGFSDVTEPSFSALRGDLGLILSRNLAPLASAGPAGARLQDALASCWDEDLAGAWPACSAAVAKRALEEGAAPERALPTERFIMPLLEKAPPIRIEQAAIARHARWRNAFLTQVADAVHVAARRRGMAP